MKDEARYNYRLYLSQPEWHTKSFLCRKQAGFRCQICNSLDHPHNRLQAHHRTYPIINGDESVKDLTCLCDRCHQHIHKAIKVINGRLAHVKHTYKASNNPDYQLSLDLD